MDVRAVPIQVDRLCLQWGDHVGFLAVVCGGLRWCSPVFSCTNKRVWVAAECPPPPSCPPLPYELPIAFCRRWRAARAGARVVGSGAACCRVAGHGAATMCSKVVGHGAKSKLATGLSVQCTVARARVECQRAAVIRMGRVDWDFDPEQGHDGQGTPRHVSRSMQASTVPHAQPARTAGSGH